jgi:sn-glycerol 3-phosphate transport system permease protein
MSVSSPDTQVLTVGLASFTLSSESGGEWGVIAAGTALVAAPLLVGFLFFQRRFVSSLVFTGLK